MSSNVNTTTHLFFPSQLIKIEDCSPFGSRRLVRVQGCFAPKSLRILNETVNRDEKRIDIILDTMDMSKHNLALVNVQTIIFALIITFESFQKLYSSISPEAASYPNRLT